MAAMEAQRSAPTSMKAFHFLPVRLVRLKTQSRLNRAKTGSGTLLERAGLLDLIPTSTRVTALSTTMTARPM
jgi:hypothetical protein